MNIISRLITADYDYLAAKMLVSCGDRFRKGGRARPVMRTGEPAYSAVMSHSDPTAVLAEMKRTEALLRDARSVLRRVDTLAAMASVSDDPSCALIAEGAERRRAPGVAVGPSPAHRTALRQAGRTAPALTGAKVGLDCWWAQATDLSEAQTSGASGLPRCFALRGPYSCAPQLSRSRPLSLPCRRGSPAALARGEQSNEKCR